MNALEQLLRPLSGAINRQIRTKTPARELCAELDGKVIAVRVRDTGLGMYFLVGPDSIDLAFDAAEPDVAITASPGSLARLLLADGESALRDGSVDLSGDVYTARAFQRLLSYGRPDLEEELAGLVGDSAARGVGEFLRGFDRWARDARGNLTQNLTEYLQEESRAVPGRYEVEKFRDAVNTLRDDVDRLEARIRRLEEQPDRRPTP